MTKKFIMILIVGVIGLAILVYLLGNQIDILRKDDMTITEITGYPITNCIYQKDSFQIEKQNISYDCLDKVEVKTKKGKVWNLKEFLQKYHKNMKDVFSILPDLSFSVTTYRDGGSIVYQKEDFSIIQCQKIEKKPEIWIGYNLDINICNSFK